MAEDTEQQGQTTPAATPVVVIVDPVESVRGEATRRIVNAGIFTIEQIQRENMAAPSTLPYVRFTIPQSAEFDFTTQNRQSKTIILEFDIMTRSLTSTQQAGQLAQKIENAFGINDRTGSNRKISLPGWTGVSATVYKFGRGTAQNESDVNIFYLPVLLYVRLDVGYGAKYEV